MTPFSRAARLAVALGILVASAACTGTNPVQVPSAWAALPGQGPFTAYADLDCPTTEACYGVRFSDVYRWDGETSTGSVHSLAPPDGATRNFRSIQCFAVTQCLLAGSETPAGETSYGRPILVRWDGTTVTEIPLPVRPPGPAGEGSVEASCASLNWCMLRRPGIEPREVWDGTTTTATVVPEGVYISSKPVCASPTLCMAPARRGTEQGVARWDGTAWTFAPVLATGGVFTSSRPPTIDCPSASFCVAAAALATPAYPNTATVVAVATWSGGSWTAFAPVPHPPGHVDPPFDTLVTLDCGTPQWCVVLGLEADYLSRRPMTLVWTGTGWGYGAPRGTAQPVPPAGQSSPPRPTTFACAPGERWCLAVTAGGGADVFTPAPPA